jgi:hypothetical protein
MWRSIRTLTRRIALVSFSKTGRVCYDAMALLIAKSLKNPSWYDKVYHTGTYVGKRLTIQVPIWPQVVICRFRNCYHRITRLYWKAKVEEVRVDVRRTRGGVTRCGFLGHFASTCPTPDVTDTVSTSYQSGPTASWTTIVIKAWLVITMHSFWCEVLPFKRIVNAYHSPSYRSRPYLAQRFQSSSIFVGE